MTESRHKQRISVRSNVEMAHRLYRTPGKCEQIHGHNWNVTLTLGGAIDVNGLLSGINFTDLKANFRAHLNAYYDHRLLLNASDPFAGDLIPVSRGLGERVTLPGLATIDCEPTTENFARIIGEWAQGQYGHVTSALAVVVWETPVNCADWSWTKGE